MSKDQPSSAAADDADATDKHRGIKQELERLFDAKLTRSREAFRNIDPDAHTRDYEAKALEGPNKDAIFRIKQSVKKSGDMAKKYCTRVLEGNSSAVYYFKGFYMIEHLI